jgi:hypothetical protein
MFPSLTPRRLADTLLELADAMLRPLPQDGIVPCVDVDGTSGPGGTGGAMSAHPHRQPVRIPRDRRRGTPPPQTHHCVTSLPARTAPTRRTPSHA